MENPRILAIHAGVAHLAYGVAIVDNTNEFKSSLDFNDYDDWFGTDFNWLMNSWLETTLNDIESDITSVDSTNLSEYYSAEMSAQSSADRAAKIAAGITPSETTSRPSTGTNTS